MSLQAAGQLGMGIEMLDRVDGHRPPDHPDAAARVSVFIVSGPFATATQLLNGPGRSNGA
jgi:hypothetical protein